MEAGGNEKLLALETGKHWLGIIFCVVKIRGMLKDTWKRESERVNLQSLNLISNLFFCIL